MKTFYIHFFFNIQINWLTQQYKYEILYSLPMIEY